MKCWVLFVLAVATAQGGCRSDTSEPVVGPAPPRHVAPMSLGSLGVGAIAVNANEWILVRGAVVRNPYSITGHLVSPSDRDPDLAPPPQLPCSSGMLTNGNCAGEWNIPVAIGDTDWVLGDRVFVDGNGFPRAQTRLAYGPGGVTAELLGPDEPASAGKAYATGIAAGPWLVGLFVSTIPDGTTRNVPLLWRSPYARPEELPHDGFSSGPTPKAVDASGRIAAAGGAPPLPAVWLPSEEGYRLEVLPLLAGDSSGEALAIDTGQIVGSAEDDHARKHAVVWQVVDGTFVAIALPEPDGFTLSSTASGTSGRRIVGVCQGSSQTDVVSVVWSADEHSDSWHLEFVLDPLPAGPSLPELATVAAISGNLAVGSSGYGYPPTAVAWRLQ